MQDILSLLPHWSAMLILVIVHSALTFSLSVPGCPTYVHLPRFQIMFYLMLSIVM